MTERFTPFNRPISEISFQINHTRALLAALERQRGWLLDEQGKFLGKIRPSRVEVQLPPYAELGQ